MNSFRSKIKRNINTRTNIELAEINWVGRSVITIVIISSLIKYTQVSPKVDIST